MLRSLVKKGLSYNNIVDLIQSEDIPVSLNLSILLRTLIENESDEEN